MAEPDILNPSGEPAPSTRRERLVRLRHRFIDWLKSFHRPERVLALFTLLVILGQLALMQGQSNLMDQQFRLASTEQQLATRPYIQASMLDWGPITVEKDTRWRIENKGRYPIRIVDSRIIDLEKFAETDWRVVIGIAPRVEGQVIHQLQPGDHWDMNLKMLASFYKGMEVGLTPVPGAHYIVLELTFAREVDDKQYVYLEPLWVPDSKTGPTPLSQQYTGSAPLSKFCTEDARVMELMHKFYAQNPLRHPAEIYNYHYLVEPGNGMQCLDR
jgi:hypothetical protein